MDQLSTDQITIDKPLLSFFAKKEIELSVIRLDKIHPLISGNKWFKLRFYIEEAIYSGKKTILTFGGAWSNHILATAAACSLYGLKSVGIVRGEEPRTLSPTLAMAKQEGMELVFISREDYREKKIPAAYNDNEYYLINEGGYGAKGADGAAAILDYCKKENYTHICCAAGTGTMLAGLVEGALPLQEIIGISVLKNNNGLEEDVKALLKNKNKSFQVIHDYHFGGYAKYTQELIDFMNGFYKQTGIPSDFVYTGKLFYAMNDLISRNFFPPGSKLLVIHSGGLQGNTSLPGSALLF